MNKGDLIQPKSGGPIMTVQSVDNGWVDCVWFDNENRPNQGNYDRAVLKLYEEPIDVEPD